MSEPLTILERLLRHHVELAMIDAKSALDRDQDKLALIQLKAIRDRPRG